MRFFLLTFFLLCGVTAHAADPPAEVAFIMKALSNPYWQAMKLGVYDTSRKLGVKTTVFGQVSDLQKEEQLNLCQAAIARHPKVIAIGAATSSIGIECLRQATAKGIKVADVDATLPPDLVKKAGLDVAFSINDDNHKIGAMAAEFIAKKITKPNPKILVIQGAVGSPPGQDRPRGFVKRIKELKPRARIVGSVSAEWDRLRALNTTADFLLRHPDLDAVFAANDVMALGAVEAARSAGRPHMIVVGVDAIEDARRAILDGRMTATVAKFPYWVGKKALEMANDINHGKKVKKIVIAPVLLTTKEILEAGKEPLLKYVR